MFSVSICLPVSANHCLSIYMSREKVKTLEYPVLNLKHYRRITFESYMYLYLARDKLFYFVFQNSLPPSQLKVLVEVL